MKPFRILILGGGFGGLRLARRLAKFGVEAAVTLVDQSAYQLYTPSLYEIVTGHDPRLVCVSFVEALHGSGVTFHKGRVTQITLRERSVELASGERLAYDHLVLALGTETNDYGIRGVKEYGFALKTVADAWLLRQHIESEYEGARFGSMPEKRRKLRFVIAGGGPTGVELAGGLAEYVRQLARTAGISRSVTEIELCEAGPTILAREDPRVIRLAKRRLARLGVRIKTESPIRKEEVRAVVIGREREATETLIWTAGVKVPKLIAGLRGVMHNRQGQVVVDPYLRAAGRDELWLLGDLAATVDSGTAQTALHQADTVAFNLAAVLAERPPTHVYEPHPPRLIMPIGADSAIVRFGQFVWQGRLGMWLRYLVDLRYFLSALPLRQALKLWLMRTAPCPDCRAKLAPLLTQRGSTAHKKFT